MKHEMFKEFVLDQLRELQPIDCRAMFGGYGLYLSGVFFGILLEGRLYFKTHPASVGQYQAHGMEPFQPPRGTQISKYYEVPSTIIESPALLAAWARQAAQHTEAKPSRAKRPARS